MLVAELTVSHLLDGHIWEYGFERGADVNYHEVDVFCVRLQSSERERFVTIDANCQLGKSQNMFGVNVSCIILPKKYIGLDTWAIY